MKQLRVTYIHVVLSFSIFQAFSSPPHPTPTPTPSLFHLTWHFKNLRSVLLSLCFVFDLVFVKPILIVEEEILKRDLRKALRSTTTTQRVWHRMMIACTQRLWLRQSVEVCWLIGESMSSNKSSRSREVCWSIGESMRSDKSSRSLEVCWSIGESMRSDRSSRSREICWSIGELVSSNKSSRSREVCWSIGESMSSDKSSRSLEVC